MVELLSLAYSSGRVDLHAYDSLLLIKGQRFSYHFNEIISRFKRPTFMDARMAMHYAACTTQRDFVPKGCGECSMQPRCLVINHPEVVD